MKRILFVTGTRADFGKMKSLILSVQESSDLHATVFATGMHLSDLHGTTIREIEKSGVRDICPFANHAPGMDQSLGRTIGGLSRHVADEVPDMIVVHGDRGEALAGAIVGAMQNILTAHIEGGEVSGTIDGSTRHAVSKMAHLHLACNADARRRLLQLGEEDSRIYVIGSPDLDIMLSDNREPLQSVLRSYGIPWRDYGILLFHPVTTEVGSWEETVREVTEAVIHSDLNWVVVCPNNDVGSDAILQEYRRSLSGPRFRLFPSIRFESFLVLLENASLILGNSSAGIREAPYLGTPTIDIGTRQDGRASHDSITRCAYAQGDILRAIVQAPRSVFPATSGFGDGHSTERFIRILRDPGTWETPIQKVFQDRWEHPKPLDADASM